MPSPLLVPPFYKYLSRVLVCISRRQRSSLGGMTLLAVLPYGVVKSEQRLWTQIEQSMFSGSVNDYPITLNVSLNGAKCLLSQS